MKQYEYAFDPLEVNLSGFSLMGGVGIVFEGHQEIIRARAKNGWEYAGFIPVKQRAEGYISIIELIFKRELPENE
jgi:hypothetical protein